MRRPRFQNWARAQLIKEAGLKSFNLRKIAAFVQSNEGASLAPTLLLYAHEAECLDRLRTLVYDHDLLNEYDDVEKHLNGRSVERLALRGAPMMSLPETYRNVFYAYAKAYHAPEEIEANKRELQKSAHKTMLQMGISPADVARKLSLDPANTYAFIVKGDVHRFTLETAKRVDSWLRGIMNSSN